MAQVSSEKDQIPFLFCFCEGMTSLPGEIAFEGVSDAIAPLFWNPICKLGMGFIEYFVSCLRCFFFKPKLPEE